jgi:hypothetical protein
MLRSLNKILCLFLLMVGLHRASAFTLYGILDDWQTPAVGFTFGEAGGSKDLGEEFRINTPVITYGFDSTFLDYFGLEGVKAIDKAFAIMNKLPKVSKMSPDLSEFLLQDAQLPNATANALNLFDLKSVTLGFLLEHMGLAGEEHVFDLQKRIPLTGTCQFDYQTIIRNFDPLTFEYSKYVNGALYTYEIVDFCPGAPFAFAVEKTVDPTDISFNAVASFKGGLGGTGLRFGSYYINLTRDDAAGLRYIYRKNNYNNEVLATGAVPRLFSGPWQPVDFFQTNNFGSNTFALRGGIEKVTFKKTRFNSLFGSTFTPFVQTYTVPVVTNSTVISQSVRRLLLQPDILFTAGNLNTLPPALVSLTPAYAARSISFLTNGLPSYGIVSSIGPGTINPQTLITFHKASPQFYNTTPFFLDEATSFLGFEFRWGSFDGSTNDPIVYPQGASIRAIEDLVLHR